MHRHAVVVWQLKVECARPPERADVCFCDSGIRERDDPFGPGMPTRGVGSNLCDSDRLVRPDAYHALPVRPPLRLQVAQLRGDLEFNGAESCDGIRQIIPLADDRLEGFAAAAGRVEIDCTKTSVSVLKFQPGDWDVPLIGAAPDKAQRGLLFLAGVRKTHH